MYTIHVIKVNRDGTKEQIDIPLEGIEKVLNPQDMFTVEFKLNEIPHLRFHITYRGK